MTVSTSGDNAPPPGLSKDNIASVVVAREMSRRAAEDGASNVVSIVVLRDLLAAYEALSARMAWLAAKHAEVMDQ